MSEVSSLWGTICTSMICLSPFAMFVLGFYLGKRGLPWKISITARENRSGGFEDEIEGVDYE